MGGLLITLQMLLFQWYQCYSYLFAVNNASLTQYWASAFDDVTKGLPPQIGDNTPSQVLGPPPDPTIVSPLVYKRGGGSAKHRF